MNNRRITYTQPELAATMVGGIAAMNTTLIASHNMGQHTRYILYIVYALGLLLFVLMAVFVARKRSILEVEDSQLRARNKIWQARDLKVIIWNNKARRFMLKPRSGFGLGMTLTKENTEHDSKLLIEWAQVHGIPVQHK